MTGITLIDYVLIPVIIGIISGVFSNYWFYNRKIKKINNLRPKIEVIDFISKIKNKNKQFEYWLKFINQTDAHLIDINISLTVSNTYTEEGGQSLKNIRLIINKNIPSIPCKDEKDNLNLHSYRIRLNTDITKEFINIKGEKEESRFLRLEIIAKHSISGLSNIPIIHNFFLQNIKKIPFVSGKEKKENIKKYY